MSKCCANFMCRAQLLSGTDAYYCCNINRLYCWNCRTSCRCSNQLKSRQVTYCESCESQDKLVLNYCKKCIDSANTRCIGCFDLARVTRDVNVFIGKMDMVRIQEMVFKMAPTCEFCGWRKTYVCVEKCCQKDFLFCKDCEGNEHLLHKTNNLAMLCLDRQNIDKQSFRQMAKLQFEKLLKLLKKERERCFKIIEQQNILAKLYTNNIEQIETLIEEFKDSWQKQIQRCIREFMTSRISLPQARKKFEKEIKKVNFWQDLQTQLQTLPNTVEFLQQFDSSMLRQSEYSYGKNTCSKIFNFSRVDNHNFLEKNIKENCFEDYSKTLDSIPEQNIMDMPDRARQITLAKINPNSFVSRLFINAEHCSNLQYMNGLTINTELPLLVELHTPYLFSSFPQSNLKSITVNTEFYRKKVINISTIDLPSSLVVLRIRQTSTSFLNFPPNLTNLPNLKYLVISDPALAHPIIKVLIEVAIKNDFRMLCLLRNTCKKNYSKIGNWQYRLQSDDSHIYPNLRRHSVAYRRKMMQVMLLQKTNLRKMFSTFKENVLETAMGGPEIQAELQLGI